MRTHRESNDHRGCRLYSIFKFRQLPIGYFRRPINDRPGASPIAKLSSTITVGVVDASGDAYLRRLLHLVPDVDLAELFEEADHGEVEFDAAGLREPRVRQVHQLQHPEEWAETVATVKSANALRSGRKQSPPLRVPTL